MLKIAKFLHSYFRGAADRILESELVLRVHGVDVPATYLRPRHEAPVPAWLALHGITVPGRHHPVLYRFALSIAATGAAVLIPEIPTWRRLRIDMAAGDATIAAGIEHLAGRADVTDDIRLVGFSFGATQALTAAAMPQVSSRLRSVVAFGGYCDLRATLRFMMTGLHEWEGVTRRLEPDPYGRWIAAANYLLDVPEYADMHELVDAAIRLAAESGRVGVFAGDPQYDSMKLALRRTLPPDQREVWDLIAGLSGQTPLDGPALELADRLATAALERDPLLDPVPRLRRLQGRIVLAHGYDDQLIPYTETLRIQQNLPADAETTLSITRLFSHSASAERLTFLHYPVEIARYLTLLRHAFELRPPRLTPLPDSR